MTLTLLRSFDKDEILGWSPVRFAEETEHWESVEMILIEGASMSDLAVTKRKLQDSERAALIFGELCRRRLVRLLTFALQQSPGLVQAELPLNRSPLHEAARSGCPATVRCLIAADAAVNAADDHGMTPLHEAAAHSNDFTVRILLDAGAVPDTTDNGGRTALHYASRSGSAACIQFLLAKGSPVDHVSADGCTALHEAATSPSAHAVRLLLDAGADKHAKSASGWTALHWAASRGRLYAVMILLEAGISVDVKTVDEETPLHLAATLTSCDIWEALVRAGADEGALDKNGRTPKERAADKTVPNVVGYDVGGMGTSNISPNQSHIPLGVANDAPLTSNGNVCDSENLSAEDSVVPLSSASPNSTTQQAVTATAEEDNGTGEEGAPSVSGQTADNKGSLLYETSSNSICESEELTVENFIVPLSSVTLNSTTQQTVTDFQEDEGASVECMSAISSQRTDSMHSSSCEEYSELSDETGSADETYSGELLESDEETDSGDEMASDEETGSDDETDSDADEEDASSYISSANEEIDKVSERGSVKELFSPIVTTNTIMYYEGPPLFHTLGTVGTSTKYNQQATKFQGKFRGRGRGAPRGTRGNAASYNTRSVVSTSRQENVNESPHAQGSRQHGRSNEKGIRRGNFNGSVYQHARRQCDGNCGQPNTVLFGGGSIEPHTKQQPSVRADYKNREPHTPEDKKNKKIKHPKSVSKQQGDSNAEHKKKKRPDSQHGVGHHKKRHGESHHGSQRGEGSGNQNSEGHLGNQHGGSHYGNRHGKGHHSNKYSESRSSNQYGETHNGNRHGEGHRGNRHGEAHYANQSGGHHSNGHYANRQGESRAGKWNGAGRGGKSHGRSRGGKS
ncbi:ankyrin-3-like [Schistocerca gregaria]|uniref:ankyrin-3-like n=1 Tax=Schistocerca gregaria TaxID=7010 RepID=UPI00211E7B54|nr:ankyrin-3-like [Schistocerca gregaria]